ncbi:unnamed protein product [Vitrella brassicaformis CCMP3155]|uniref:Uncharacterized protein n=1 Tax=Vitrella brassicaformis (strain CCMP3155) TaxID=1169540 RepID=A0A0G4EYY2_VITBC|nr:unnamed protein product [Vitrella brassicaformis CCMP3155]|eukprot:CEM04382.1 unnamed protein product [Vitrella brassicaformis CCMP3155]
MAVAEGPMHGETSAARVENGISKNTTSSAASAANGASHVSCVNQHQQHQYDRLISPADVPDEAVPLVAEYVRNYSQLEALIAAHPTQFTAAVLLPILIRLLPVVVEAIFGGLMEVPMPQLTQRVSIIVAITRRLFIFERGGDWARWRPVLEMLYLLRGRRIVVLSDDNFSVFGSRAAFIGETEAVRRWKILSRDVTVSFRGQQRRLMNGDRFFRLPVETSYYLRTLFPSGSPLFPHDTFDPANPPTKLSDWTSPSYTSMVAFILLSWLYKDGHIPCIKAWWSCRPDPAAYRRVCELLAAPPSDATQWGAGAAVFDEKWSDGEGHERLVVLGSEAMGEGHMALIKLEEWGDGRYVGIYATLWAPSSRCAML